jgi:hypothetical protein
MTNRKIKGYYKTPSGTYRARKTVNGTRLSKNFITVREAKAFLAGGGKM